MLSKISRFSSTWIGPVLGVGIQHLIELDLIIGAPRYVLCSGLLKTLIGLLYNKLYKYVTA